MGRDILIFFLIVLFIIVFIKAVKWELKKTTSNKKQEEIPGKIKILINELEKLEKLSYDWDILELISEATISGKNYIFLQPSEYEEIKRRHSEILLQKRNKAYYFELVNNAMIEDKNGSIESALKSYETAFQFALANKFHINSFAHCVNRLVINYRKTKQKQKEIDLLYYMLENYKDWNHSDYDKWNERLAKLI